MYKAADIKQETIMKTTNKVIAALVMLVAAAGMALAEEGYQRTDITGFDSEDGAVHDAGAGFLAAAAHHCVLSIAISTTSHTTCGWMTNS